MNDYKKIDDKTIEVTKPTPAQVTKYDIGFLKNQEQLILKQINDSNQNFNNQLIEIREFINQANNLGIQ